MKERAFPGGLLARCFGGCLVRSGCTRTVPRTVAEPSEPRPGTGQLDETASIGSIPQQLPAASAFLLSGAKQQVKDLYVGAAPDEGPTAATLAGLATEKGLSSLRSHLVLGAALGVGWSGGQALAGTWNGALAVVKLRVVQTADELQRAAQEALLSRSLSHPALVQCFAVLIAELTTEDLSPAAACQRQAYLPPEEDEDDDNLSTAIGSLCAQQLQHPDLDTACLSRCLDASATVAGLTQAQDARPDPGGGGGGAVGSKPRPTTGPAATGAFDTLDAPAAAARNQPLESPWRPSANALLVDGARTSLRPTHAGALSWLRLRSDCATATTTATAALQHDGAGGAAGMSIGLSSQLCELGDSQASSDRVGHTRDLSCSARHPPTSPSHVASVSTVGSICHCHSRQQHAASCGTTTTTTAAAAELPGGSHTAAAAAAATQQQTLPLAPHAPSQQQRQPPSPSPDDPCASLSRPCSDGTVSVDEFDGDGSRLHTVLLSLGAAPGKVLTAVVLEFCDCGTLLQRIQLQANGHSSSSGSGPAGISLLLPTSALRARAAVPDAPCQGLGTSESLRNALEIAQGMSYLHSLGIAHGDLKPANVLLRSTRSSRRGYCCKIADFGLSNTTRVPRDAAQPQRDSAFDLHACPSSSAGGMNSWGTLAYMAPEVPVQGAASPASDVYSFGALLWHMTTGQQPFHNVLPTQLLVGVVTGELQVGPWPESVDPALAKLGAACLSHDPAKRPSFDAVARTLALAVRQHRRAAGRAVPPRRVASELLQATSGGSSWGSAHHRQQQQPPQPLCYGVGVGSGNRAVSPRSQPQLHHQQWSPRWEPQGPLSASGYRQQQQLHWQSALRRASTVAGVRQTPASAGAADVARSSLAAVYPGGSPSATTLEAQQAAQRQQDCGKDADADLASPFPTKALDEAL